MESFSSMEITRRDFVGMGAAGGPKLQRRIEFAAGLEKEMTDILAICKMVRQREEEKLQDVEILNRLVDTVYFPIAPLLLPILKKAQGLDQLKSYFRGGFTVMKHKLEERYYTTVASFSTDINAVFRDAIGFDTFASSSDANEQFNSGIVPHDTLTAEQKDMKKNAKRIIKAIQSMLNDASRKETELGGKPAENDFSDLEALLDRSLSSRRESVIGSTGDTEMRDAPEDEDNGASQLHMPNGRHEASPQLSDTKAGAEDTSDTLRRDDNMDINIDPALLGKPPRYDTTDEAIIHLRLASSNQTVNVPIIHNDATTSLHSPKPSNPNSTTGSAPPIENEVEPTEPLTPPRSERDLRGAPANGGVPWYLASFDPIGTTVHEEEWKGRDIMRALSEDLSDMDEADLNELVDDDEIMVNCDTIAAAPDVAVAVVDGALSPPTIALEGKAKKKPRRRKVFGGRAR